MIHTMKKKHIFCVSICLLLTGAPALLNAASDDREEEHTSIPDTELPPLKLLNSFCALKADDGPCKAMIKRFFFNIHTQQCEEFIYGGCKGNQNRFESLEECKEKCVRDYPKKFTKETLQKAPQHECIHSSQQHRNAHRKKGEFPKQHTEHNSKNVAAPSSVLSMSRKHCPEKPEFCFLEEDAGPCRGYITRYFYYNQSKQCERFKYGGCLGNLNNFDSLEECKNTCEDTLNEFQVDDYKTQLVDMNNNSLTPQPTKSSSFWESKKLSSWQKATLPRMDLKHGKRYCDLIYNEGCESPAQSHTDLTIFCVTCFSPERHT
ncbi:tissue factor pathway inhibitor isoform X2 [Choloepus didactylus]|uniref:tissue factor pathway inhibitor isoform X2 n=1 Tax=Choloepus didactylus TaxID=27675 RepID=UPI0018A00EA1|nr:tissue factor pathway inhibitor isoform X2 [Choloepus didactylus]